MGILSIINIENLAMNNITPAPPDSRLRWMAWDPGSLKQDPAAGELIR